MVTSITVSILRSLYFVAGSQDFYSLSLLESFQKYSTILCANYEEARGPQTNSSVGHFESTDL